jgi:outer membrane protein OmpA-like peptidoglycan-associated protein
VRSAWLAACALATLAAACAGSQMRAQVGAIDKVISAARGSGAQTCAPVELALAESHRDFASLELDEGDFYRARRELAVAEKNAHAALRKSPAERCVKVAAAPEDQDGDGIADDRDECPAIPEDKDGFEDGDGCPDSDNDNDGLADARDGCPVDPEDKDGFEDDDGCPDDDNDQDGLADSIDPCPVEAEDRDGVEDEDGCPDADKDTYQNVVVTEERIEIKQTVHFDTGRATIKRVSFPLLDEVAQALADHPKIRVRVEGHTDSQGQDAYNLRLSRDRARAVREYLEGRGVDGSRMTSDGYGETRPISDNRTAAGRAQNRRVEFLITDR